MGNSDCVANPVNFTLIKITFFEQIRTQIEFGIFKIDLALRSVNLNRPQNGLISRNYRMSYGTINSL